MIYIKREENLYNNVFKFLYVKISLHNIIENKGGIYMTTIGMIAILVGIVFISIEQKKGILMILGGSFVGIGSNPINLGMIILGFGLLGLSIKLILEDRKEWKNSKRNYRRKMDRTI